MYRLVSNGAHLYKKDGHLVREPINMPVDVVPLTPDGRSYYSVAGFYYNGTIPCAGVIGNDIVTVGKLMRKYYLGSTSVERPGNQFWRQVTSAHDPEFVWYQGSFNISENSITPPGKCEAYMQLAAYHFTIPSEYRGRNIVGAALSVIHGGTVFQHKDPYSHYCPLQLERPGDENYGQKTCFSTDLRSVDYPGNSFDNPWNMNIAVLSQLNDEPCTIDWQMQADFNTHLKQGHVNDENCASKRQLWYTEGLVNTKSGYIPVTTSPWVQSIPLNAACISAIRSNNGGWVVVAPNVGYSNFDDRDTFAMDYPFFYPNSRDNNSWLCCSMWGYGLSLSIQRN